MIDLTKLTPAPWRATTPDAEGLQQHGCADGVRLYGPGDSQWVADVGVGDNNPERVANAVFIILARNAFDVLARLKTDPAMLVCLAFSEKTLTHAQRTRFSSWAVGQGFTDFFTALVEADAWYRQHVKGRKE